MFKENFITSMKKLSSTKNLALLAISIALNVSLKSIFLPVGDNLRIYFTFVITVLESAMFGPAVALISGFVTDIVGFILFPSGTFFIGYTISEVLGHFIYALFLYNRNITIFKIFISKLTVNLFVNVTLGSLWSAMLYSKGYMYYLTKSLIKNITLLPIEVILLGLAFNYLIPVLNKKGFIKPSTIPLKLF